MKQHEAKSMRFMLNKEVLDFLNKTKPEGVSISRHISDILIKHKVATENAKSNKNV